MGARSGDRFTRTRTSGPLLSDYGEEMNNVVMDQAVIVTHLEIFKLWRYERDMFAVQGLHYQHLPWSRQHHYH